MSQTAAAPAKAASLSQATLARFAREVAKYPAEQKQSAVMACLAIVQQESGWVGPEGEAYAAVEHPKGEFGIYLISDGANKPYRMKIRPPGFVHLSAMDELARGTCWPTRWPSSARWISCLERLTDE
jgi:NADH:ubiquinone oxidoreductase subunit D